MTETEDKISAFNKANPPPKVRRFLTKEPRGKTTETLASGAFVFNAFDHLENLDSPSTEAFADAQNARTDAFLRMAPDMDSRREAMVRHMNSEADGDPVEAVQIREWPLSDGKALIQHFETATGRNQYFYRSGKHGEPQKMVDSRDHSVGEEARLKQVLLSPDQSRCAVTIDYNGGSTHKLLVFDMHKDGSVTQSYAGEKSYNGQFRWDEDSQGFSFNTFKDGRSQLLNQRLDGSEAKEVFDGSKQDKHAITRIQTVRDAKGALSSKDYVTVSWNYDASNEIHVRPKDWKPKHDLQSVTEKVRDKLKGGGVFGLRKQKQIEVLDAKPHDPNEGFVLLKGDGQSFYHPIHEQDGMLLMHTNENAPRGKVIAVGTQPPYAEREIIPQHPTDRFVMLHISGDTRIAQYNHDGGTRLTVLDKDFKPLRDLQMPEQAIAPTHSISIKGDKLSLTATSFKHASEDITFDLSSGKQTASKVEPSPFDLPDAVVERVYATSKDGTRVPMTIIRPKDVEMDGTAAVQLSGYGGFNTVLGPQTNPDINDWVSRGGIYVQANLRGGGEFGKDWYDQGRLHNKQNVFDDFAACAEFLSKEKYTSPERLAIEGTSNGGLLTLATAMQRPELFGAVLSNVPVTDMLTERWPGDYGKAREQRGDFENNMAYSPLHTVKEKVKYPPMMVKTGKLDPTVPASDTYKFVATMQAKSPETLCLMRVDKDVAHNATSIEHTAKQTAEQHAFLETVLGPIDQKQFKAAQKAKEAGTQKESALVPKIDLRALEEVKKISQKVTLNSDLVAAAASHTSFADKVKNAASPKNAGNSR